MILSLNNQLILFLTSILMGFTLGTVFDVFKILRKVVPHSFIALQIEDTVSWLIVLTVMFLFILDRNFGEIRVFCVIGAFLGMITYFMTLSILIMKISDGIISFVKYTINLIVCIFLTPFRLLYMIFRKPIKSCRNFASKKTKKVLQKYKLYVKIKKRRIKTAANVILKKR